MPQTSTALFLPGKINDVRKSPPVLGKLKPKTIPVLGMVSGTKTGDPPRNGDTSEILSSNDPPQNEAPLLYIAIGDGGHSADSPRTFCGQSVDIYKWEAS